MILADADTGTAAFANPAFWVNLGAVGVIACAFMAGKLHSTGEMDRIERANESALKAQKEAHADAMQRADDQVRQLMLERDRSNAERDEAIGVMRDFTLMAGTLFNSNPPTWRPKPQGTRRGGPRDDSG